MTTRPRSTEGSRKSLEGSDGGPQVRSKSSAASINVERRSFEGPSTTQQGPDILNKNVLSDIAASPLATASTTSLVKLRREFSSSRDDNGQTPQKEQPFISEENLRRFMPGGQETITPTPPELPLTSFSINTTGIPRHSREDLPDASSVAAKDKGLLREGPFAQNAITEAEGSNRRYLQPFTRISDNPYETGKDHVIDMQDRSAREFELPTGSTDEHIKAIEGALDHIDEMSPDDCKRLFTSLDRMLEKAQKIKDRQPKPEETWGQWRGRMGKEALQTGKNLVTPKWWITPSGDAPAPYQWQDVNGIKTGAQYVGRGATRFFMTPAGNLISNAGIATVNSAAAWILSGEAKPELIGTNLAGGILANNAVNMVNKPWNTWLQSGLGQGVSIPISFLLKNNTMGHNTTMHD